MHSENHQRPVYKKEAAPGTMDVLIYFWDERDGPNFCGWWFGPQVGGDQVWAYNSSRTMTPPASGWKVPYDGPLDPMLQVAGGCPPPPAPPQIDHAALMRQQQEEEQRKRLEEQRKLEMEERARQEQTAIATIRQAVQKLQLCTAEAFPALQKELDQVFQMELPKVGSFAEQLRNEAVMAVQRTQQRHAQEEARRQEMERLRAEQEAARKKLYDELKGLSEAMEQKTAAFKETFAPALALDCTSVDVVMEALDRTTSGEIAEAAKASCKACTDLMVANAESFDGIRTDISTKANLVALQAQIHKSHEDIHLAPKKLQRKIGALKKLEKQKEQLSKYCNGASGMPKSKISTYAKEHCKFELSPADVEKIAADLCNSQETIPKESFHKLKLAIGICREVEASRKRLEEKKKKEAALAEERARLQEELAKLQESLSKVEAEVQHVMEGASSLDNKMNGENPPTDAEIDSETEKLESTIKGLKDTVFESCKTVSKLVQGSDPTLQPLARLEGTKVEIKARQHNLKLDQVSLSTEKIKEAKAKRAAQVAAQAETPDATSADAAAADAAPSEDAKMADAEASSPLAAAAEAVAAPVAAAMEAVTGAVASVMAGLTQSSEEKKE